MIKHNAIFYFLLVLLIMVICFLIYLFSAEPFIYIAGSCLLASSILLIFHLFLYKRKFDKIQKNSHQLIENVRMNLDEEFVKKLQQIEEKYLRAKQSEDQFREAFETAMQGMALLSLDGSFIKVNTAICDTIGYSPEDLIRTDLQCITHPDDYIKDRDSMNKLLNDELLSFRLEKRLYHAEGLTAWVLQNMKLIKDEEGKPIHFVAQFIDITERKQTEEQLKKYTETLTVLLREVNHRVKNNLAALISMLHMEQNKASNSNNTVYVEFLNDLISRIQSLSTVHSMLSAQNWQPLGLSELFSRVIHAATHGMPGTKKVRIQIAPSDIKVNSNQAHHLTLVINELITNSIKHAMHGRDNALISVDISKNNENIHIRYKDDGPGFPLALIEGDFRNANIGFELIRGIVVQSLDGSFSLENNNGATANIWFQNELESV